MSIPKPPVALKGHCSVVYNNTLYTFQPDAFQSLNLEAGGKWSRLPMGLPTNGSVCLQGSPKGQDSMFVVGGITTSSMPNYDGLQRYVFKTRKWETIKLSDTVAKDRQGHGSAYLNSSSSIIIYAGYQDRPPVPSSQLFSISMIPPYNISSYTSTVPPLLNPLLMPWNASHALMVGGDQMNKDIYMFGPGPREGWRRMDRQLSEGLKDSSKVQTAIMNGSHGSKVLQIFDMSVSPNSISLQELPDLSTSAIETQKSRKRKRQKTSDRPPYNSTLASQTQRNGFSLAQDATGLIVFSGGEPASSDEVLYLFNQTGNQWIDTTQFFAADITSSTPHSTPTSVPPAIGSTPPSTTPAASQRNSGNGSKNHSLTILGATLGAVFGLAAILIMILLLLRCLRRRRETTHKRKTSDYPSDNKNEMDFADRGVNYMQEAGGAFTGRGSHHHTGSGNSTNSMAIMSGTIRASSSQSKRGFLHRPGDSNGSSKSLFSRAKSPLAPSPPPISGPILNSPRDNNMQASPEPRTEPRTDTGWSRYFTNNSSTNLANAGNTRRDSASRPTTYASGSQSDYTSSRIASSHPRESAEVQPLSIRTNAHHPPNARIVSPTSGIPLALQPGISPSRTEGSNPPSPSTLVSEIHGDDDQHGDRGHDSEEMASWTPIAASDRGSTWEDRPISSVYTESVIYPHPGERVRIPNFPRVPSTTRNSTARNSTAGNSQIESVADSRGLRSMASRDLKSPPAGDQDRELPEVGSRRIATPLFGDDREVRPYPKQPEEWDPRGRRPDPEDMSWLNLGR